MNTITFEEILARDGKLVYRTKGCSMLPMLHQNRDLVIIEPPTGRLKRRDIALFRRGKDYVLHRVIKVCGNDYVFRGDNNYFTESGIPDSAIVGVLTGFVKNGKQHSVTETGYRFCSGLWLLLYPIRFLLVMTKRRIKKLLFKDKKTGCAGKNEQNT